MTSVQVVARIRPLNAREKSSGSNADIPVVTTNSQTNTVTVVKGLGSKAIRSRFQVSKVFNAFSTQEEVFEPVRGLVDDVLQGFDATVFAFGQTGTGKTYTMEGETSSEEHMGVIPRACRLVFDTLAEERFTATKVSVSYLEIYNENLSDLLADAAAKPLRICTTSKQNGSRVTCMGLSSRAVSSPIEILRILDEARERRQVAETKMNKQSSRSHVIFTISIRSSEQVADGSIERCSKLHLVDLAGSECAKSTGSSKGARMQESKNINKSLLTLGRVITSLRTQSGRIPYRDSKLTRLLQEALGGRSKTLIIATLSPSIISMEESLSTMAYAEKAHGIVNKKVEARARMAVNAHAAMAGGSGNIEDEGSGGSRSTFAEMEARLHFMSSQCREAQAALAKKHLEVSSIVERAEVAEASVLELTENLDAVSSVAAAQKITIGELTLTLAERDAILRVRRETEAALTSEALSLINTLDHSISYGDELHQGLAAADTRDREVREAVRAARSAVDATGTALICTAEEFSATLKGQLATLVDQHLNAGITSCNTKAQALHSTVDPNVQAIISESSNAKQATSSATESIGAEGEASLQALNAEQDALISATKTTTERFSIAASAWRAYTEDSEAVLGQWGSASADRLSAALKNTQAKQESTAELFKNQSKERCSEVNTVRTMLKAQHDRIVSLAASLLTQSKDLLSHEATIERAAAAIAEASEDMIGGLVTQQDRLAAALVSTGHLRASLIAEADSESSHLCSIQEVSEFTDNAFSGLSSTCAAQKDQLQDTISALETARDEGVSSITFALGNLREKHVEMFTRAQIKSFAAQKSCVKAATKAHALGRKQASAMKKHLSEMKGAATSAFASHKDMTTEFSNTLATASAVHQDGTASMSTQQRSHISSARDTTTIKGERSQGTLMATSAALTEAAQAHTAAQARIHEEQCQKVEGMRTTVVEQMAVVVPKTLRAQDDLLENLLEEQAAGQAAAIASTMAAVQDMLTAKMAELQASLAAEVTKMREGNERLLGAAGATSDAVESGEKALASCVHEAVLEGAKVHKVTESAVAALNQTETTVSSMVAAVAKDLENMEINLAKRNEADSLLANSVTATTDAMSNKFRASLTETEDDIVQTVDSSLTLAANKWAAAIDTAAENIENIGKTNTAMNKRHKDCISATRDASNTIELHVQAWSTSNAETRSSLNDVTMGIHNEELNAGVTAAAETFQEHITRLKDETTATAKLCDATHDMLVEIQSESAVQQATVEEQRDTQSTIMDSLRAQTVAMRSTATPALVDTVDALTECNAELCEHAIPELTAADVERASFSLQALNKICEDQIAILDTEVKSTADMIAKRKNATLADTASRATSMDSTAQDHVTHMQSLIEAQKVRARESWARMSDASRQVHTCIGDAANEIGTLAGSVLGATKALTVDISQETAEMESACKDSALAMVENAGAFSSKVTNDVNQGIMSKIGTLSDDVVKAEVIPEILAVHKVFEFSKELSCTPDEASITAAVGISLAETSPVADEEEEEEEEEDDEEKTDISNLVDAPNAPSVNIAAPSKKISKSRNVLASLDRNATSTGQKTRVAKKSRGTGLRRPSKVVR
jgi:kinesin family protein 11